MTGRAHPILIAVNLWRSVYLVAIPVLRGFATALQGGFTFWLAGAWADLLILLLMLLIAVLSWRRCRYSLNGVCMEIQSGLFFSRRTVIGWERISALSCASPFFLRPFRAALLRADTLGGSYRDADITLWLSYEKAREITEAYRGQPQAVKPPLPGRWFSPGLRSVLLFSVLNSSSLGGVAFLAAFLSQSGKLLGGEFSSLLISAFEEAARSFALGAPPVAAAAAYALLAGWLIGFALTVLRCLRLSVNRSGGKLSIQSGYFTRREHLVDASHINFIDIRQTAVTRLLGLHALYVSAAGYGKRKDDAPCVFPASGPRSLELWRGRLFPGLEASARQLKPCRDGVMAYLYPAVFYLLALLLSFAALLRLFPAWERLLLFAALMLLIPGIFFFSVRCLDYSSAGISRKGGCYTMRYSRGFRLHTVVIPPGKAMEVILRQSPVQRARGNCDLVILTPAERRSPHKCRNLVLKEVQALLALPL